MLKRPRRNRVSAGVRGLVRETSLTPGRLILPMFVHEGPGQHAMSSMPGRFRHDIAHLVETAGEAFKLGVPAVALFPALDESLKDPRGSESLNDSGLLQRAVRALKQSLPELVVVTDVALDPYSSDGHDGVVIDDRIDNDVTVPVLAAMAVAQH